MEAKTDVTLIEKKSLKMVLRKFKMSGVLIMVKYGQKGLITGKVFLGTMFF